MNADVTQALRMNRWTAACANRECDTGWLQLFRSRSFPRFEGKWACSTRCMERIVAEAVRIQIENWEPASAIRPLRMPLGLILLSRGWITHRELQEALAAQRRAGRGRIGEWLRSLHGIPEATIAKSLAIQWNCAVLPAGVPGVEFAPTLPAFLRCRYGLALLRQGPAATFYLAGRYCAENAACRALEHMLGAPVQATFLEDSAWSVADDADLGNAMEMHAGRDGAAASIADLVEQTRPINARLVRIHDHLWLRVWLPRRDRIVRTQDAIFPLRAGKQSDHFLEPVKNVRS